MVLGVTEFGSGGEKCWERLGVKGRSCSQGLLCSPCMEMWVKQGWENSAEATLEKKVRAAYGRKKITKGSWRCIITIMICEVLVQYTLCKWMAPKL